MTDQKQFEVGPDGLCDFERKAMECAKFLASRFGIEKDSDEHHDAMHQAWILAQNRRGTPGTIAWFACKRVVSHRIFDESVRSIDGPREQPKRTANRFEFRVIDLVRENQDPAEIVATKLDFEDFLKCLPRRLKKVCKAYLNGLTTGDVAKRFKVSPARASQYRREIEELWEAHFAEL